MLEEDLPESDSSDEDFVPTGERSDVSEEESDDDVEEQVNEDENKVSKRKKTKSTKGSKKKKKKLEEDSPPKIEEEKPKDENPEEKKKRADALWADFLSDCGPVVKKKSDETVSLLKLEQTSKANVLSENDRLKPETSSKSKTNESGSKADIFKDFETKDQGVSDKVTEVYEFAGEKVIVEKRLDRTKRPIGRGGGVASILNQINKKTKLSTLEKSKLDWESFKETEGIDEEISAHNRGKNGYLEKRDFLERADLRQFEIEKKMREHNRSKRL